MPQESMSHIGKRHCLQGPSSKGDAAAWAKEWKTPVRFSSTTADGWTGHVADAPNTSVVRGGIFLVLFFLLPNHKIKQSQTLCRTGSSKGPQLSSFIYLFVLIWKQTSLDTVQPHKPSHLRLYNNVKHLAATESKAASTSSCSDRAKACAILKHLWSAEVPTYIHFTLTCPLVFSALPATSHGTLFAFTAMQSTHRGRLTSIHTFHLDCSLLLHSSWFSASTRREGLHKTRK